jgi:hypothetical protein
MRPFLARGAFLQIDVRYVRDRDGKRVTPPEASGFVLCGDVFAKLSLSFLALCRSASSADLPGSVADNPD